MRAALAPALVLCASLLGCWAPHRIDGAERALALYREGRAASGALGMRREHEGEGERTAKRALPAGATLGVEEAVALARQNSARLAELEARADAAEKQIEAAGQWKNPEVRVSQVRLDQVAAGKAEVRTSSRVSPPRPGERDARMAVARAAEAEARAAVRAEEQAMEAEVRWLVDDLLLVEAEIAAAERASAARRTHASRVKDRLAAGEATAVDETLVELFAIEAEQDAAALRARRATLKGDLGDRLGLDPKAELSLRGGPLDAWPPPALPSEQALVELALQRSAAIAASAARIDGADARLGLERGKRWPWLTFVDVGYEAAPGATPGLAWTLQAGFEVPLFNANGAGVRAAEAGVEASKRALAAEAERVAREVRARLREALAAEALVTAYLARSRVAVERAGAEAQRALDRGGIDVVRALVIEERRVLVEIRALRLLRRHRAAMAELLRALGGPLPRAHR